MHRRTSKRASTIVLVTALATALSTPLTAHAVGSDDPSTPTFTGDDSVSHAQPQQPQVAPSRKSKPLTSSTRMSAAQSLSAPGKITGLSVMDVGSTWADIAWSSSPNGGSPITGYAVRLWVGDQLDMEETLYEELSGVYFWGLHPDTTYQAEFAAINAEGTGPFSDRIDFTTTHSSVDRIFGQNRFETSVRVSEDVFPSGGFAGFLANGLDFPDALAAAAAGGASGSPVLLTQPRSLSTAVKDELFALQPEYVFAAGGPAAVSDEVLDQVETAASGGAFRLAGKNRFGTAAQVAELWATTDTVYLASGMTYPDALTGAAAAGYDGAPVLLTTRDTLPSETAAALKKYTPSRIVVLGGPGSVSEAVASAAKTAAGGTAAVERLAGADRYLTGVAISKATFSSPRVPVVYVASGAGFADALAGAAAAGYTGGPMLLTSQATIPAAVLAEIDRLDPIRVVVLGGPGVIGDGVTEQIQKALG